MPYIYNLFFIIHFVVLLLYQSSTTIAMKMKMNYVGMHYLNIHDHA